ncbi:hypothetical protein [Paenacidovorax monticola]|uniref:DUF4303 domain-containing protein n=1 Tax=Paenacidovorax monticola TaxID=1926868 RepID=A0A7H0HJ84_9BURK|nr:hypothetical protein [Paenacidovorax monticola]QNP60600.1 hypothetical protein H9L24_07215 [Paenacidovorax monticola]
MPPTPSPPATPWDAFLAATGLEALLRELTLHTLAEARRTWPGAPAGFAFNCSAAWGDVHISLASDPARAAMEPPDWEHECAEAELPASAVLWRARYEPVRERYEAERVQHASYPEGFLGTLRHLLARMEREGVFADAPGIRLLVTEVDADTAVEEAALAQVRRNLGLLA